MAEALYYPIETIKIEPHARYFFPTTLVWSPIDPLAVTMLFPIGPPWTTSHQLIAAAAMVNNRVVGTGDIQFRPVVGKPHVALMQLRSPHGNAVIRIQRADLGNFLCAHTNYEYDHPALHPHTELNKWLEKTFA